MKMIEVDGYRAFHGSMIIRLAPDVKDLPPFTIGPCDWIYIPKEKSWRCEDYCFYEYSCTPVVDDTQ